MGLDMYLYRKTYVQNWDFMEPKKRHEITVSKGGKPTAIKPERISYIIEQVAYWRKANSIHKWFVDHVQDGVDDCREAYVEIEQLKELRDLCYKVRMVAKVAAGKVHNGTQWNAGVRTEIMEDGEVITNPEEVAEMLPTQAGFFFGCTDYNGYYLQDVNETYEVLDKILQEEGEGDFYYHSSW